MLDTLQKNWREFKRGKPGQRFRERYRRKRRQTRNVILGWSLLVLGALLVAAGLFFLPAPGPGTLILLAGAGLMAQESLGVARLLDRAEVLSRDWTARSGKTWTRSPARVKTMLVIAGLVILAALCYGAWELTAFGLRLREQ